MGLREEKKRRTRAALRHAALALFLERGFEQVTVAEVAAAAGVSVNTAFNYFPAKEDLFFDRQGEVEAQLASWVRERTRGRSPSQAVRDGVLRALAEGDPSIGLSPEAEAYWRTIDASPALRARSRESSERAEAALAAALAEEAPPDDPLPRLLAGALAGTFRAVVAEIRQKLAAGEDVAVVRVEMTGAVQRMFDALIAAED
ncbi:MAG: TetR family transcriptional regulator [Catenulispora sp.]|nr:TetR family transcriptional regulator [Catenulispora sp.]